MIAVLQEERLVVCLIDCYFQQGNIMCLIIYIYICVYMYIYIYIYVCIIHFTVELKSDFCRTRGGAPRFRLFSC